MHSGCSMVALVFVFQTAPYMNDAENAVLAADAAAAAGKGPIKIVKNIPQGLPPVSIQDWVPIGNIGQLLPLAFIVLAVDMLESTSIARALARKNGYGGCWLQ